LKPIIRLFGRPINSVHSNEVERDAANERPILTVSDVVHPPRPVSRIRVGPALPDRKSLDAEIARLTMSIKSVSIHRSTTSW
jgi:hypothetical protein